MEAISDFIISLLPSNDYVYLIYLGVITLFSVLLILFLARKRSEVAHNIPKKKEITINDLLKIAKNPKSNIKDLAFALEYYVTKFRVKDYEKESFELFKLALNHKNRKKMLFDIFHGKILPANLKYKEKLEAIEKVALNRD